MSDTGIGWRVAAQNRNSKILNPCDALWIALSVWRCTVLQKLNYVHAYNMSVFDLPSVHQNAAVFKSGAHRYIDLGCPRNIPILSTQFRSWARQQFRYRNQTIPIRDVTAPAFEAFRGAVTTQSQGSCLS